MTQHNNLLSSPALKELEPKDFTHLIGMDGFSERMLTLHFQLYAAYVKNTNSLLKKFNELRDQGDYEDPSFNELKRRFGWEYNSVKLHELYFGNLGGQKTGAPSRFRHLITDQFGSYEKWQKEFLTVAATRGIGWAVLYEDRASKRLINAWIDEHNNGHLIQSEPILVLDVFEHAFMTDYGIDRPKYLAAFMKNVDWNAVESRITEGK